MAASGVKYIRALLFFCQFFKSDGLFKINFQNGGILDAVCEKSFCILQCQINGNFTIRRIIKVKI
jgi:hypothetical protein